MIHLDPKVYIETPREALVREACEAASVYFGKTIDRSVFGNRRRSDSLARHFVMLWLCWKHADRFSALHVSQILGVNHTSILYARKNALANFPDAPFLQPALEAA